MKNTKAKFPILRARVEYHHHFGNLFRLITKKKLILVLGAGVSLSVGIPDWSTLIDKIREESKSEITTARIQKLRKKGTDDLVIGQLLYNDFRNREMGQLPPEFKKEELIESRWKKIVRDCLYENKDEIIKKINEPEFILKEYAPLIKKIPLTINYNFDDVVETLLRSESGGKIQNPDKRDYEVLFGKGTPSRETGGIYHLNGFIPHDRKDISSETIILTESQFNRFQQESYVMSRLRFLFQNYVCLFIGSSFRDPVLKENLILNKRVNPGHYHYAIVKQGLTHSEPDFIKYLFNNLNVIPLNLTDEGVAELGEFLSQDPANFKTHTKGMELARVYYLVGPPGAGKTTVRSLFDTLHAVPEWLSVIKEKMIDSSAQLTRLESEEIDTFVLEQTRMKAGEIRRAESGIVLVDRSPLDAGAFPTPFENGKERTIRFRSEYMKIMDDSQKMVSGSLIYLTGTLDVLFLRKAKKRYVKSEEKEKRNALKGQINACEVMYQGSSEDGVFKIETSLKTPEEVVTEIAEIVFNQPYKEIDILDFMDKMKDRLPVKHQ